MQNPPSCIHCDGPWLPTRESWEIAFPHMTVAEKTQQRCGSCGDRGGGEGIPTFTMLDELVRKTAHRIGRLTGEEYAYLRKRRAFKMGWEEGQNAWREEDSRPFVTWEADKRARAWEGVDDLTLGILIIHPFPAQLKPCPD